MLTSDRTGSTSDRPETFRQKLDLCMLNCIGPFVAQQNGTLVLQLYDYMVQLLQFSLYFGRFHVFRCQLSKS